MTNILFVFVGKIDFKYIFDKNIIKCHFLRKFITYYFSFTNNMYNI